jgi:SAM-dependent methyltransferase
MPTLEQARQWLDRWDRQQEHYMPDREERFQVVCDVVAAAVDRPDPVVVDLGAGPGSLSTRVLDRLPAAQVYAVDADPLLLGLARIAHADRPGLRIVEHDLRDAGWVTALGADLPTGVDAIVSTTALHWLTRDELMVLYRTCAGLLRPGGVLVDADHFDEQPNSPRLRDLTREVAAARGARAGTDGNEDWAAWWDAAAGAAELAAFTSERGVRPIDHSVADAPTLVGHRALLRDAGFSEAGTVWQFGHDRVLVAVR